jgi:hypothetical protein
LDVSTRENSIDLPFDPIDVAWRSHRIVDAE